MLFIALAAVPPAAPALELERSAIGAGQWYRLLTAHIVHANLPHALANAGAAAALFGLFGRVVSLRVWMLTISACALTISAGLLLLTPLDWYVGFSGVLHGLFAFAALLDRRLPMWLRALLLAGIAGKVLNELFGTGPESAAWLEVAVISEAHAIGALTGAALAAVVTLTGRSGTAGRR